MDPPGAELASVDPEELWDGELSPNLVELRRLAARVEAATARVIAAAERRGIPTAEGSGRRRPG